MWPTRASSGQILLLPSIFSWRRATSLLPNGLALRLGLFCARVMDKAPTRVGLLRAEGSQDGSLGAGWTPWGLGVAGRDGPSTASGQGSSSLVSQRLADSQMGFACAPGAGRVPALVWKSFGRANATVTQSSARHWCRACVCWLSGHQQTCLHSSVPTGRGRHGDGNRNV